MGKRDDKIAIYARDLREKCGVEPDMDLLRRVTIACGPAIYDPDAELVAAGDPDERARVKRNFLMRRLGLPDSPELGDAIDAVLDIYGRSEPRKYRAVVYYLLTRHFGRQSAFA